MEARTESSRESRTADLMIGAADRWQDACRVAALLCLDSLGFGGVLVRGGPSPARTRWTGLLEDLSRRPAYVISGHADLPAISGSVDPVAALASARSATTEGLARKARSRTVLIRMADQLQPAPCHAVSRLLDGGHLPGGLVLFDEGEERGAVLDPLVERLSFRLEIDGIPMGLLEDAGPSVSDVEAARGIAARATVSDEQINALSRACLACGLSSMRALAFAVAAAKGLAALEGRGVANDDDVAEAARLVIAPRAKQFPDQQEEPAPEPEDQSQAEEGEGRVEEPQVADEETRVHDLEETVADAVAAGVVSLAAATGHRKTSRRGSAGRSATTTLSRREGRPFGSEPGDPRRGGILDLTATLRAAAPWQRLRPTATEGRAMRIYPSDLRIKRFAHKTGSSIIFVVDASGSAAMHRLAEAKGAVENLLAECYSRRDTVSLLSFRGSEAETVLPPSRSLTRARRAMAGLPGGGGTPLPAAMALALKTAVAERRQGRQPLLVFLSDGRGNVSLSGEPGRGGVEKEAEDLGDRIAEEEIDVLFFDTSPRPKEKVQHLTNRMRGRYVPLPYADSKTVSVAVRKERRERTGRGR